MNQPVSGRAEDARPPGVIDALTAGYAIVNKRLWVVLVPVLLDVFLWLGPQVSLAPVIDRAAAGLAAPSEWGGESSLAAEQVRRNLLDTFDSFNALALLAGPSLLSVPSLAVIVGGRGTLHFIDDPSTALLLLLGSTVGGTIIGSFYRSTIAQQVRDRALLPGRLLVDAVAAWLRVLLLMLCFVGFSLLFGLPLALVLGSAAAVSRDLLGMGVFLVSIASMAVFIYLAFALDAVFVSRAGPLTAIRNSVAVVRAYFWPTVMLMGLMLLILLGMGRVWELLALAAPWGILAGIVGNAYIASGLVAASMAFYQDRFDRLPSPARTSPASPAPVPGSE